MQVAAMADYEPRMLLKTISSAPQRVGLGATLGASGPRDRQQARNNLISSVTRLSALQRELLVAIRKELTSI
jgi:hypothetical protein